MFSPIKEPLITIIHVLNNVITSIPGFSLSINEQSAGILMKELKDFVINPL